MKPDVRFDGFTLDVARRSLNYHGQSISIRPKELDLLGALIEAYPSPLSHEEIMFRLWPDGFVTDAALSQTVYRLRRALARYSPNVEYISTIPGNGYQFVGRCENAGSDAPAPALSTSFQLYRRAMFQIGLCSSSSLDQAIALLNEAIRADDAYVPAIVALGKAHAVRAEMLLADPRVEYSNAKQYAAQALALDPTSGEAYALISHIFLNFDRDSAAAGEASRTAMSMAPYLSDARTQFIWYLLSSGDWNGAISQATRALTNDPSSAPMTALFGICLYYAGRPADAHAQLADALLIDNLSTSALLYDAMALLVLGNPQAAAGRLDAVVDEISSPRILALRAHAEAQLGHRERYASLLRSLENSAMPWHQGCAIAKAGAGDVSGACDSLRSALEMKEPGLLLSRWEPLLKPLTNQAQCGEIFRRISTRTHDRCEDCGAGILRPVQRYQCVYSCTFCAQCAQRLEYRCPNCSGVLQTSAG